MGRTAKPKTALGQRLVDIRGERFRVEFAEFLNTSQHSLASYERGQTTPNMEFLEALARREGINLNWLLTGEGEMYLPEKPPAIALDADLMEAVVVTVDEFQEQNRRFNLGPEKRWLVYMECYRKLIGEKEKYPPHEMRIQLKERCRDLLKLATL